MSRDHILEGLKAAEDLYDTPELGDFSFNDEPEDTDMNVQTEMQSIGQVANGIVKTASQALTARDEHPTAPVPLTTNEMTPMAMVARALEMGVSADILKQMMDLRDREEARQAKLAFTQAVAAAKAELGPILRTREVNYQPQGKDRVYYRHEDLAGIERQVTPILTAHGLSYRYESDNGPDRPITVTCVLEHVAGHFTRTALSGPPDSGAGKNSLQAIASTTTYLQRYTLKLALGLSVDHDDDGKASDQTIEQGPISKEQVKSLLELITKSGAEIDLCCEKWGIGSVPELPASKFDEAYGALEAWHKRQQKGAA